MCKSAVAFCTSKTSRTHAHPAHFPKWILHAHAHLRPHITHAPLQLIPWYFCLFVMKVPLRVIHKICWNLFGGEGGIKYDPKNSYVFYGRPLMELGLFILLFLVSFLSSTFFHPINKEKIIPIFPFFSKQILKKFPPNLFGTPLHSEL